MAAGHEDQPQPKPKPKASQGEGGLTAGWIFAWIMPGVGFLIGLALIAAGNSEGGKITTVSVVMSFVWFLIGAAAVAGSG